MPTDPQLAAKIRRIENAIRELSIAMATGKGNIQKLLEELSDLSFDTIHPFSVKVGALLDGTTNSLTDTWSPPSKWVAWVTEIVGTVNFRALTSESTLTAALGGNVDVSERELIKLHNTKVTFKKAGGDNILFEDSKQGAVNTLRDFARGQIWRPHYAFPLILLPKESIEVGVSWIDTTASIEGDSTTCGLSLRGSLVRVVE